MESWYVYILKMRNWRYYVWSTIDVWRRFDEHCRWLCKATKNNRLLQLLFQKEYIDYKTAFNVEQYIKKQKSRSYVEWFMRESSVD